MNSTQTTTALEITYSQHFLDWLGEQQISLALTTYQTARLILLGLNSKGQLSGFERLFQRAMGLFTTADRLYMSSYYQLWQFENVLAMGQSYDGYDKLYIPRIGYTTGDLDIHDIAVDGQGRIVFVSTLLNCLATVSLSHSCTPLWHPPFISKLVNEDRCHLNGLAMANGMPAYVTACGQSDIVDGWRYQRHQGGCVIDVRSNEVIATGLSMPHSPRFYQNRLWLLNSGTGEFGYLEGSKFVAVTFCSGYPRGLAFFGNMAIVGLSKPRDRTFSGLPLDERLTEKGAEPRCGLMVIDLTSGSILHWLHFEGVIGELYDVQVLNGVRRPMAIGLQTDEIARILTLDSIAPLT